MHDIYYFFRKSPSFFTVLKKKHLVKSSSHFCSGVHIMNGFVKGMHVIQSNECGKQTFYELFVSSDGLQSIGYVFLTVPTFLALLQVCLSLITNSIYCKKLCTCLRSSWYFHNTNMSATAVVYLLMFKL